MKFKKFLLFFFSIILGIVLVGWLINKVGLDKILKTLTFISWWHFSIIFFLSILIFIFYLKKWEIIVQPYNYSTNLKRLIIAILGEQAISFITPVMYIGGEGLKALLLKEDNENRSFTKTFNLIILDRLAEGYALLIFFILGGIISFFYRYFLLGFISIFISLMIIFIIFLILRIPEFSISLLNFFGFKKVVRDEGKIKEEINFIKNFLLLYKKNFYLDIFVSFLILILKAFQIYLLIFFLGESLSIFKIYFIKLAIIIGGIIPTPGSLGGLELIVAYSFSFLNLPLYKAIAMLIILRTVQIIFVSLGIILVLPYSTVKVYPFLSHKNNRK